MSKKMRDSVREAVQSRYEFSGNDGKIYSYYRLGHLSEGAFGKVYHGTTESWCDNDEQLKEIAIKVISMSTNNLEKCKKTFKDMMEENGRLGRVLAVPKDPHMICILAAHFIESSLKEAHQFAIVMDYAKGSLSKLLNDPETGKVSLRMDHVRRYTKQIAGGLSFLHRNGIVHTDLKPHNILVSQIADNDEVLKIGDWDDPVFLEDIITKSADITRFMGTIPYVSPEMARKWVVFSDADISDDIVGRKTDVWSLGCVAIFMVNLSHELIFKFGDEPEVQSPKPDDILRCIAKGGKMRLDHDVNDYQFRKFTKACHRKKSDLRYTMERVVKLPFLTHEGDINTGATSNSPSIVPHSPDTVSPSTKTAINENIPENVEPNPDAAFFRCEVHSSTLTTDTVTSLGVSGGSVVEDVSGTSNRSNKSNDQAQTIVESTSDKIPSSSNLDTSVSGEVMHGFSEKFHVDQVNQMFTESTDFPLDIPQSSNIITETPFQELDNNAAVEITSRLSHGYPDQHKTSMTTYRSQLPLPAPELAGFSQDCIVQAELRRPIENERNEREGQLGRVVPLDDNSIRANVQHNTGPWQWHDLSENEVDTPEELAAVERKIKHRFGHLKAEFYEKWSVALFGMEGVGKSTFVKNMRLLHMKTAFANSEKEHMLRAIHELFLSATQNLIETVLVRPLSRELQQDITVFESRNPNAVTLSSEKMCSIYRIWKAQEVPSDYHEPHYNIFYFVERIPEILKPSFLPSKEDILRLYSNSLGIQEHHLIYDKFKYNVADVSGEWIRRHMQLPSGVKFGSTQNPRARLRSRLAVFHKVDAVIFVAALSDYDQPATGDPNGNALLESVEFFRFLLDDCKMLFRKTTIILFLNKQDVFIERVKKSDIWKHFPDFKGNSKNAEEVRAFILGMFLRDAKKRIIYPHFTCLVDREKTLTETCAMVAAATHRNIIAMNTKNLMQF